MPVSEAEAMVFSTSSWLTPKARASRGRAAELGRPPIPGLFGAGNAVASIFGATYPGGGATLGPGVTFGYVAGLAFTS